MEKQGKIITLNTAKENLTVEKLKTFAGCEYLSDEQATETVFALQTFANILYELMSEQPKNNELKTAA